MFDVMLHGRSRAAPCATLPTDSLRPAHGVLKLVLVLEARGGAGCLAASFCIIWSCIAQTNSETALLSDASLPVRPSACMPFATLANTAFAHFGTMGPLCISVSFDITANPSPTRSSALMTACNPSYVRDVASFMQGRSQRVWPRSRRWESSYRNSSIWRCNAVKPGTKFASPRSRGVDGEAEVQLESESRRCLASSSVEALVESVPQLLHSDTR